MVIVKYFRGVLSVFVVWSYVVLFCSVVLIAISNPSFNSLFCLFWEKIYKKSILNHIALDCSSFLHLRLSRFDFQKRCWYNHYFKHFIIVLTSNTLPSPVQHHPMVSYGLPGSERHCCLKLRLFQTRSLIVLYYHLLTSSTVFCLFFLLPLSPTIVLSRTVVDIPFPLISNFSSSSKIIFKCILVSYYSLQYSLCQSTLDSLKLFVVLTFQKS